MRHFRAFLKTFLVLAIASGNVAMGFPSVPIQTDAQSNSCMHQQQYSTPPLKGEALVLAEHKKEFGGCHFMSAICCASQAYPESANAAILSPGLSGTVVLPAEFFLSRIEGPEPRPPAFEFIRV